MSSEHVGDLLPEYAETGLRPAGPVEEHLASCAACSSELSAYRTLLGSLESLRTVELDPPAGYLDRTLRTVRMASFTSRIPSIVDLRRASARALARAPRAGYALASLGGAAAAAAIALVWWRLARRAVA